MPQMPLPLVARLQHIANCEWGPSPYIIEQSTCPDIQTFQLQSKSATILHAALRSLDTCYTSLSPVTVCGATVVTLKTLICANCARSL